MFFQINVTPKEKKTLKVRNGNDEEEIESDEHFELVLAPFQPQTRMKLDTTVYNSAKCCLNVKNPSNKNLIVNITKMPPVERCVVLSSSQLSVDAESSVELEISWTPQEAGSWRDILQLTDSRRIKYDVALVTTCRSMKKPGKEKPRILGPANTNRSTRIGKISPPKTREPKKNIHAMNPIQPTVPSKRPRLNATQPSNKENVSKIGWTYESLEVKKTTHVQSYHDFSMIMNSTKFNLTPLKEFKNVPEIKLSSAKEVDLSFQNLPALRRETYNPGGVHEANSTHKSHEFSVIMNSTNFNFTPIKSQSVEDDKQPRRESQDKAKISFSPQEIGIVSPEMTSLPILRRETYVTGKTVPLKTRFVEQEEDEENEENFVDSLSPQPEIEEAKVDERKPSEFSIFINDMNFLTPKGPSSIQRVNFSPHGCSTGNRTKSIGGKLSPNNDSSLNLAGNNTFDISSSKMNETSEANGTYELVTSPKASTNLESLKRTRLSQSFGLTVPCGNNSRDSTTKHPLSSFSSTPMSNEICSARTEYSIRPSISHYSTRRNYDDASVKEVLEADLWLKADGEHSSVSMSSMSTKKRCSSLDRIDENVNSPEPIFLKTLNRTKTLPAVKNEKLTKFRRIEISPPKKHSSSMKADITRRVSPTKGTKIRKEKNSSEPASNFRKKVQKLNCSIKRGQVSLPGVRIAKLSLAGLNRSSLRDKSMKNEPKEISVKLHDPNDFLTRFCNPDPFGATMTQDPFLTSTLYYDEKWMHHQEMEFKKWLNALLTPPEHLDADVDTIRVDVGKVWQSCRNREDVGLAETREVVSARYHTNTRLNTLRKAACAMFRREEVTAALSKVTVCVERGTLMVRHDRDLHRDIGLQKEILELFLSYNPLWLRIGLETVYGETIPLHSNNDLVGLTRFIISRFFSDPFIVKTHSHANISSLKLPSFTLHMNKFILKKFLLIVYFLDYAKTNKLIRHDPCLFHKRASHKESREILLTFSREVLSGVGDLTKVLRSHGYIVTHKQTYLDEYDYAVKDIATDLRDGVRLCRVMELITGDGHLTRRCRVPAISRLQKVHNADLALAALLRCGYTLTGEIDAKSVADGHREKTLSLLWQIIYKYQAPRYEKATKTVQRWWRSKLWYIRVRIFLRKRRNDAASTIQRAWKCYRARRVVDELREERKREWAEKKKAVEAIEFHWIRRMKMLRDRRDFLAKRRAALCLQRCVRRRRETAPFVNELRTKRQAVETIQSHWRARNLMKKDRTNYVTLLYFSKKIQTFWRAKISGRRVRREYQILREAAILVQSRWRALRLMRKARESFRRKVHGARIIQSWWRRHLALKRDRNDFLLKKHAVRTIEDWLIAGRIGKMERDEFEAKRAGAIVIQRNFRRYLQTRDSVKYLRKSIRACGIIQQWWRSARIAERYRAKRKSSVTIQRWWRGLCLAKSDAASFQNLRRATIIIQKTWRMKKARRSYLQMKDAVSRIESWYENLLSSRSVRHDFLTKRDAALKLQNWWRNLQITRKCRFDYLRYTRMVIVVQKKWRSIMLARRTRSDYLITKKCILKLQATWKMKVQRRIYRELLKRHGAAKILQKRWRETRVAKQVRKNYIEYRSACIFIQTRYRELKASRDTRTSYLKKRKAAIIVQKNWRMLRLSRYYNEQRKAALVFQSRWRARIECMETRKKFIALRRATIKMQLRYRSKRQGLEVRNSYLKLRSSVIHLQRRFRANKSMKEAKKQFLEYRRAAIILQSHWRMILQRRTYRRIKKSVVTIQIKWRAVREAREVRSSYNDLRRSILFVQRRYRANESCKLYRKEYEKTRERIIWIQRSWRKKLDNRMRDEAAINIQTWWKSILAMRECSRDYEKRKLAALVIQQRYRAYKIGSETRRSYFSIVRSIVKIQRCWRRFIHRKLYEQWVRDCKEAVSTIENWWVVILEKRREKQAESAKLRRAYDAATVIQSAWRGHLVRTSQCSMLKELRERSKRAAKAAVPSATVAFQLRESMDMLLVCDTIGQLSMCLTNIDTLTRLSLKGCVSFCELNLVDKIYWTIAKSNRSIPWLDVCLRCTSILITLTKLPETKKYTYRVEFIETLARLMTVAIDHHVSLFLHLATLLWLLSENPDYANAITSCPRSTWLLSNLHTTISKKKNKSSTGILNKSRGKEQTAQLPNSKPDWGLKNKRPRLFTTVHHAISSLIRRLKIDSST